MEYYYHKAYGQTSVSKGTIYYNNLHRIISLPNGKELYHSNYGETYIPNAGTMYYNKGYGEIWLPNGAKLYHHAPYGKTYVPNNQVEYVAYLFGYGEKKEKSSDENCFISSACLVAKNFSDDCFELETLRKYRDKLAKEDKNLRLLLKEYYQIAPKIVKKIDNHPNRMNIYDYIYDDMVLKTIDLLVKGKYSLAINHYEKIYRQLKEQFEE